MRKNSLARIGGTWSLERFQMMDLGTNTIYYPYGTNPIGILILGIDGYMSVNIMSNHRQDFVNESQKLPSVEEMVSAYESYFSYTGLCRIEDSKIYIKVLASIIPNWKDREHVRSFELKDQLLYIKTPIMKRGDSEYIIELTFKRNEE